MVFLLFADYAKSEMVKSDCAMHGLSVLHICSGIDENI